MEIKLRKRREIKIVEEEEEGNKIAEGEGKSVKICVWLVCWHNH